MQCSKSFTPYAVGLSLLIALCLPARGGDEQVFKGVIVDSQCAMNVHSLSQSHKEMLQGKSVGTTKSDCVWHCVTERGGRFVLQNKSRIYKLDKQDLGREYAGHNAQVTGTLDSETNTIHVRSIELVDGPNSATATSK